MKRADRSHGEAKRVEVDLSGLLRGMRVIGEYATKHHPSSAGKIRNNRATTRKPQVKFAKNISARKPQVPRRIRIVAPEGLSVCARQVWRPTSSLEEKEIYFCVWFRGLPLKSFVDDVMTDQRVPLIDD